VATLEGYLSGTFSPGKFGQMFHEILLEHPHAVHVPAKRKALVRGGAGCSSLDEHRAEAFFKVLDALRDSRRGHVERSGGPFEATGPDDRGDGAESCIVHRHLVFLYWHQRL